MTEVLSAREAELLCSTAEDLQARLTSAEARAQAAEERAERIATDMDLLEKEQRSMRRRLQDHSKARNEANHRDPEAVRVRGVIDHYCERTGRKIKLDAPRFDLIKSALKLYDEEPEIDADAMLRKAINGVAAFPFVVEGKRRPTGKRSERFWDIELILRNASKIERFSELVDDDDDAEAGSPAGQPPPAPAGDSRTTVTVVHPTPLDRAITVLRREYGIDVVYPVWNDHAETPQILEYWSPCPVDPTSTTLRLRHKGWGRVAAGSREAPEFACLHGCRHEDIAAAIRKLEEAQEGRAETNVIPIRPKERAA